MRLVGGRYSNLLIYSILLNFILNIRRRPIYAIPVFVVLSFVYFFGDKMMYENFPAGPVTSVYKGLKFFLFFYIFLYDYSGTIRGMVRASVRSVVGAVLLYGAIVGIYSASYHLSRGYFLRKETGLALAKLGYPFALPDLQKQMVERNDVSMLSDLFRYGEYYHMIPDYPDEVWYTMLFSQKSGRADDVAKYMLMLGKKVPYDLLVSYVSERSANKDTGIIDAENFMTLSALSMDGSEGELMKKMELSGKTFTVWGIRVLGEQGKMDSVPFLLRYLGNVDESISQESYLALRSITGIDPAQEKRIAINNPEVFYLFKKFYLGTRTRR
ncbi:MAG TPA: hypothetical protein VF857_03770 [Spirochaetota bacterium]